MRTLLTELALREDEYLETVLDAAWRTEQAISGKKIVTRSSLLYGTVIMDGLVREVLRAHGFDRRRYEEGLGVRPDKVRLGEEHLSTVDYEVHPSVRAGVEWYAKTFDARPLDGVGLAAVILHIADGAIRNGSSTPAFASRRHCRV